MKQTSLRRAGMALDIWRLFHYQSQLCRWLPLDVVDVGTRASVNKVDAGWLGKIQVGGSAHHALRVPPGQQASYRLVAPPYSRLVAWCGLASDESADRNDVEFVATVRDDQQVERTARLRLRPNREAADRRWRKLVVDLQNREQQEIEVTLAIR